MAASWCATGCRPPCPPACANALRGCELVAEGEAATIDPGWGEPGLSAAEKIYGWNSFIVLALLSGRPENPVNAVAPNARASCQIRYTVDTDPMTFEGALRRHLDAAGFPEVAVVSHGVRMACKPHRSGQPLGALGRRPAWRTTLGRPVQLIPNSGGGLPGDVFVDHLDTPLVWVPHSYKRLQAARPRRAPAGRAGAGRHRGIRRAVVGLGGGRDAASPGLVGATGIEPVTLRV